MNAKNLLINNIKIFNEYRIDIIDFPFCLILQYGFLFMH